MLDGLLGRSGFYTKCKSLIKQTRTRIEVVRRKRSATQKFLRKDIADLLANGLEKNAYGRADGLVSEMILASCYDFIDHVCEIILKHLPVLQKLRDCPEDCREAVASLMFAAARFSDLPELRELRDLFQGRYGSSVEYYVNQKLVENLSSQPPSMEKNVQLLQEIASEFSLRWDIRGFEERMANAEQKHQKTPETHAVQSRSSTPVAEETVRATVKNDVLLKKRSEASYQGGERQVDDRQQTVTRRDVLEQKDEVKYDVSIAPELSHNRYKPLSYREETLQKREDRDNNFHRREKKFDRSISKDNGAKETFHAGNLSHGKRFEPTDGRHELGRHRQMNTAERDVFKTLSSVTPDKQHLVSNISPTSVKNEPAENIHVKIMRKVQEDITDGSKSKFRGGIPPPYVKPQKSKHRVDAEENDTLTFHPKGNSNGSGKPPTKPDFPDAHENMNGNERFTEIYYKDEGGIESTPRRRSHRRRHSRSASTQDAKVNGEVGKEERVVRRVSTSRRRNESKKGLQVVIDDDHYDKVDEEMMIDKLLLHYCKKPSSRDLEKPRRHTKSRTKDALKSPIHEASAANSILDEENSTPRKETSRSMSFPPRQVPQPEQQKVFVRAASFQPDSPAKHVHPKLPNYDDLAARFAALRANKD
ncbi:uncharacterized protein LOC130814605 [Amaranthus tricolor]|uniref:uncharacterized protein LOC130814605 n=1 Tax=Amaranthus tricolor TaxID=29722 RepID=UPI0025891414|nr:uncharacterized protein LOC130814605 [Amaranthus tricolor]